MSLFPDEYGKKFPQHEQEVLLIERLTDEATEVLLKSKSTDLHRVKSVLFDLVVITKLLTKLGLKFRLEKPIKEIRDSIAHVDERLESFNFKPTVISGQEWHFAESNRGQFKMTKTYNFQGAISKAMVSTTGMVEAVGPYGMIDGAFIWIDKKGNQQNTLAADIRVAYTKLIKSVSAGIAEKLK